MKVQSIFVWILGASFCLGLGAEAAVPVIDQVDTPFLSAADKCSELKGEIKNLRQAQSFLMKSLVQKNDTLAETLDIFAKDILGQKSRNLKSDSKKMKQAANSFRSHSVREQGLVDRFEALAQDLYSRIDDCLVVGPVTSAQ